MNSILAARLLAFVGEISWGIQIGWAIRVMARNIPLRGGEATRRRIRTIIPLVGYFISACAIIANISSVAAMVTRNYALSVVEETLWACMFFSGSVSSFILWHFGIDAWSFDWGSNCFGYDINPFDE